MDSMNRTIYMWTEPAFYLKWHIFSAKVTNGKCEVNIVFYDITFLHKIFILKKMMLALIKGSQRTNRNLFLAFIYLFIYLEGRATKSDREGQRHLPFIDLLLRCLKHRGLGQSNVKSLENHLGLSSRCWRLSASAIFCHFHKSFSRRLNWN